MDDLMNRITALVEAHVKSEVEARGSLQTQHADLVSGTLETVRDILGAPAGLKYAADAARLVVKERDKAEREAQALREQVQALEAKLLEVRKVVADEARAPLEVDGFRVGDLVRHSVFGMSTMTIARFERKGEVNYAHIDGHTGGWSVNNLAHKPIEVGDTVRCAKGRYAGLVGVVDGTIGGEARVVIDPSVSLGEARWVMLPRLVAVAP